MSVAKRKEIVDFVDAATEWGSVVLLLRGEGEGYLKMADWRLVTDLETGMGGVGARRRREGSVMARGEQMRVVLQDRRVLQSEEHNERGC